MFGYSFFLNIMNIRFLRSVNRINDLPSENFNEIILCGRSNVGKSSFINTVFNRKNLAKTSSYPGKTRSLNYYLIEDKLFLVDLPGFGYAKVSKKDRENWKKLIEDYLESDRKIIYAFHFIDSRHSPTKLDLLLNDYLSQLNIPVSVILSKVDKLNQSEKVKSKNKAIEILHNIKDEDDLLFFSAVKGTGKKQAIKAISSFLN
jgi:GTP-binding protein